jgi:hypothetical protein
MLQEISWNMQKGRNTVFMYVFDGFHELVLTWTLVLLVLSHTRYPTSFLSTS